MEIGFSRTKAAFWMIGAIISFTSMTIAGRAVSNHLDTFEIMLYRSVIGFIIILFGALILGTFEEINSKDFGLHFFRNIFHFFGQNLWFFALPIIPLAELFALEFTSPIWVILLGYLFLRENLTKQKIFIGFLGLVGVLIIARPNFMLINIGVVAAAAAAIGFAATAIMTRKLTIRNSLTNILFHLTGLQIIFSLICAGYDNQIRFPVEITIPWLFIIGLTGLSAHFCLTKSLTLAPASIVMPIDFARLPLIVLIGVLFYGESIDIYLFLGAALILIANYLNVRQ